MKDCADCGGFDVEWMYSCQKHKGVEYCRGCSCPFCDEDALDEEDYEIDEHGDPKPSTEEPICKACGNSWPDYLTASGPHACSVPPKLSESP